MLISSPRPHGGGAGGGQAPTTEQLADLAEQAASLAKADLVTEMVGEFPELQGVMGGYYARAEGLPDAVADAIRDHYKPVGQGDEVPTAPVTVAVALADKLDSLASFIVIEAGPTGSRDPFALRRAGLAILSLIFRNELRLGFHDLVRETAYLLSSNHMKTVMLANPDVASMQKMIWPEFPNAENVNIRERLDKLKAREPRLWPFFVKTMKKAVDQTRYLSARGLPSVLEFQAFLTDRLKVQQKEAGVRHDLIDAVFALGGEDDLVRLLARVKALQSFIATDDGTNLLAGYKRAANILKKEETGLSINRHPGLEPGSRSFSGSDGSGTPDQVRGDEQAMVLTYTPEPAEADLITALDTAEPRATAAVTAEDFEGAMAALATLRAPIDAFFDKVTVNDADPAKRSARLALLARVRDAVHAVADFSRIAG